MKKSLRHHLLIASPFQRNPYFSQTVLYVVRHDEQDVQGFIINRPSKIMVSHLLKNLNIHDIHDAVKQKTVLYGGEVRPEAGFVLHQGEALWQSSVVIADDVCLTTSRDILEHIAQDQIQQNHQVILGFTSWRPEQLEEQIALGDWLIGTVDPHLLFSHPIEQRWELACKHTGIDVMWFNEQQIGHPNAIFH